MMSAVHMVQRLEKLIRTNCFTYEAAEYLNEMLRRMIVEGFFDPIMQRIPFEGVRDRFSEAIEEKMGLICYVC